MQLRIGDARSPLGNHNGGLFAELGGPELRERAAGHADSLRKKWGGLCADRFEFRVLLWRSCIAVSSRDALEPLARLLGQAGAGGAGGQLPEQLTGRGRREIFEHFDGTDGTQLLARRQVQLQVLENALEPPLQLR